MNKADVMKQPSMEILLEELIKFSPGITSDKLYTHAKDWHGKLWYHSMTTNFEWALSDLREKGYRVTNKQWYPQGHQATPKPKGPSKEDPRQTRMFG